MSAEGGCSNIYEFHAGAGGVLVAGQRAPGLGWPRYAAQQRPVVRRSVAGQGVDASGGDVLFTTADPLIPSDVDNGQRDVYDARVGGGFPLVPGGESGVCSAGSCEGPVSSPAVVPPGSVSNTGEAPVVTAPVKKIRSRKKLLSTRPLRRRARRRLARKRLRAKARILLAVGVLGMGLWCCGWGCCWVGRGCVMRLVSGSSQVINSRLLVVGLLVVVGWWSWSWFGRVGGGVLGVVLGLVLLGCVWFGGGVAWGVVVTAPSWRVTDVGIPSVLPAGLGKTVRYDVVVENVGGAASSGGFTIRDVVPAGVSVTEVHSQPPAGVCETVGREVSCSYSESVVPGGFVVMPVFGVVSGSTAGGLADVASVSGGGAPGASGEAVMRAAATAGEKGPGGVSSFGFEATGPVG